MPRSQITAFLQKGISIFVMHEFDTHLELYTSFTIHISVHAPISPPSLLSY